MWKGDFNIRKNSNRGQILLKIVKYGTSCDCEFDS